MSREAVPYGMPLYRRLGAGPPWACGSRGPDYHKAQVGHAFALIDLHPMDRLSNELAADPQEAREVIATLLSTRRFKGQDVSRAINGSRCAIKPSDDVWYVRCEFNGYNLRTTCAHNECSYQLFRRHDDHGNIYE
jgi:hypothetical protein